MDKRIRRSERANEKNEPQCRLPPKSNFHPISQSIGYGLLIALTIASLLGSSVILLVFLFLIPPLTLGFPLSSFNDIFSNPITIASEASFLIFIGCVCAILHIDSIEHPQE